LHWLFDPTIFIKLMSQMIYITDELKKEMEMERSIPASSCLTFFELVKNFPGSKASVS